MGRQWNQIIESLGPLTGGTMSINANLTDIEALLTTLQADVADGIIVNSVTDPVASNFSYNLNNDVINLSGKYGALVGYIDATGDTIFKYAGTNNPFPTKVTSGTITSGTVNASISPTRGTTTIGTLTAGTTNGTLFASNSTRNYLLIQCTSGTAFIDTNGTATTADGIQLTSGQGITFEGSYIPTGAISAITSTGTARLIGRQG
jgi:hypothetical protein